MDIIKKINNQLNSKIKPTRIISLVPSITELLFYLGLKNRIIGVTNFCKYPEKEIINITKVGGTKTINFDVIEKLNPDLIIAVKEENTKDEVLKLTENFNVFIGDLFDYKSALQLILEIGKICKVENQAVQLVSKIEINFLKLNNSIQKTCCYFIWNKPIMTVGGTTFISSMLEKVGFKNVFSHLQSYPEINEADIIEKNPEYILLSSEPFKFTEKHRKIYQEKFPKSRVVLVDGEMFSWYGSRMLYATDYFKKFLI